MFYHQLEVSPASRWARLLFAENEALEICQWEATSGQLLSGIAYHAAVAYYGWKDIEIAGLGIFVGDFYSVKNFTSDGKISLLSSDRYSAAPISLS